MKESHDRFRDGKNIKEGIRIYDEQGSITPLIVAAESARKRSRKLLMQYPQNGNWLGKKAQEWAIQSANKKYDHKRNYSMPYSRLRRRKEKVSKLRHGLPLNSAGDGPVSQTKYSCSVQMFSLPADGSLRQTQSAAALGAQVPMRRIKIRKRSLCEPSQALSRFRTMPK